MMPSAEVWHIGLYRDEKTLRPVQYYNKLPVDPTVQVCLILDPMLATGGSAIANYDSVATLHGGQNIVQSALDHFGRLDILINNAGILRDKSFAKMSSDMWHAVLDVHLQGAFNVTHPAFQIMRQQGYGRIVFATSAAGLFGNFGQTNYVATKAGVIGMTKVWAREMGRKGITANAVAPSARTGMTSAVPEMAERMKKPEDGSFDHFAPENVSNLLA